MGGMMGGMGAQAAPMTAAMPSVGRGGVTTNNLATSITPTAVGAGGGLMDNIFKAMFDPEGTASMMAKQGLTPDEFMQKTAQESSVASVVNPRAQAQQGISPAGAVANLIAPQAKLPVVNPPGPGQAQPAAVAQNLQPGVRARPAPTNDLGGLIGAMQKIFGGGGAGGPGTAPGTPAPSVGDVISPQPIQPVTPAPIPTASATPVPISQPVSTAGTVPPSAPSVIAPPVQPDTSLITPIVPYGERSPNVVAPEITTGGTLLGGAVGSPAKGMGKNALYNEFMKTLQEGGMKNPNALAAIAATGESESGFREKNVFGSWNDPSVSGEAGTAGGVMSWRAERFNAMRKFVKDNGGDPNHPSPALQAKFLLAENPDLIKQLEAAKTPEEAMKLMNNAWRFKGYDQEGGEAARRIALARNLVGSFGGEAGTETTTSTEVGAPGTTEKTFADKLAELSDALAEDTGGGDEYHGPPPPGAVAPGRGDYQPDPNMMKLMMLMLASPGASIPTLTQLMSGAQRNG